MPRDDRPPAATDQPLFWDKNPIAMRNIPDIDIPEAETDAQASSAEGNARIKGSSRIIRNTFWNSQGKDEAITSG